MKICPKCKQEKDISQFRLRQRSEDNTKKRTYTNCKDCEKKINNLLAKLKKENKKRSNKCECCGRTDKKIYLDHCHDKDEFRGWLCNNCNVGISRLNDNVDGVVKALNYLLSKRDSNDKR